MAPPSDSSLTLNQSLSEVKKLKATIEDLRRSNPNKSCLINEVVVGLDELEEKLQQVLADQSSSKSGAEHAVNMIKTMEIIHWLYTRIDDALRWLIDNLN